MTFRRRLLRTHRHLDRHGVESAALKTIMLSGGPQPEVGEDLLGEPLTRSMNIACRCPLAPTTWVWNVIESSTIGWKPG